MTNTYKDIPAGSACSVTETANGATPTVTSTVAGANQTVTVQAGTVASLSITDTFSPAPGAVEIVKTIDGPAAGRQGLIGILLICRAPIQVFAMVIPAGHPAGQVSQVFNGVGGGSICLAAEVIDGHTDAVAVQVTGASQQVTAPAASVASVQVTDTFSGPAPAPSTSGSAAATSGSATAARRNRSDRAGGTNAQLCGRCDSCRHRAPAARA